MPGRRSLAGDHVHLVVTVEMHLEGLVSQLLALQELVLDVRIAGRPHEGWEPVEAGHDAVLDFAGGHLARPANDGRNAEAAFECRAFAAGEGGLPPIWPGEVLGAIVCGEAAVLV